LLFDVRPPCPLRGKLLQVIADIPFSPATAGKRARPSEDHLDIHPLLEQALDVLALRAAAMAHHFRSAI